MTTRITLMIMVSAMVMAVVLVVKPSTLLLGETLTFRQDSRNLQDYKIFCNSYLEWTKAVKGQNTVPELDRSCNELPPRVG